MPCVMYSCCTPRPAMLAWCAGGLCGAWRWLPCTTCTTYSCPILLIYYYYYTHMHHVHVARGMQVDYKIVEVALYFMSEVLRGEGQGAGCSRQAVAAPLPVLLLTNDNAQLMAARAHGLPALRLAAPTPAAAGSASADVAAQLQQVGERASVSECRGGAAAAGECGGTWMSVSHVCMGDEGCHHHHHRLAFTP